jgi:hypothetical protein
MPATLMNLKILLPFQIFAERTGVSRIVAESHEGSFGLLPQGHSPMFKRRTLFVVGAGASYEVGMPTGFELAKRIVKLVDFKGADQGPSPNNGDGDMIFLGQFLRRFGLVDAYRRAGWAIRDGVRLTHSIDDFLDMHNGNETVQRMGKSAIAQTILAAETDSALFFNPYGYQETFNKIEATWFMKFSECWVAESTWVTPERFLNRCPLSFSTTTGALSTS